MSPRSTDTVNRILSEAAELFMTKGYEATSMRDIALKCGISKSLLYHHFTDKYQIFTRATSTTSAGLNETVTQAIADISCPKEKLRVFMLATAGYFENNRLSWISASQEFWNSNEPKMSMQVKLRRDAFEKMLRAILDEGVQKGVFQIEDTRLAGRLILSSLNWMHRWYKPGGKRTAPQIAEAYFDMIAGGIVRSGNDREDDKSGQFAVSTDRIVRFAER